MATMFIIHQKTGVTTKSCFPSPSVNPITSCLKQRAYKLKTFLTECEKGKQSVFITGSLRWGCNDAQDRNNNWRRHLSLRAEEDGSCAERRKRACKNKKMRKVKFKDRHTYGKNLKIWFWSSSKFQLWTNTIYFNY